MGRPPGGPPFFYEQGAGFSTNTHWLVGEVFTKIRFGWYSGCISMCIAGVHTGFLIVAHRAGWPFLAAYGRCFRSGRPGSGFSEVFMVRMTSATVWWEGLGHQSC